MISNDNHYTGCPVQQARQFIAGKWQMGIFWNLRSEARSFGALKSLLPGISDKILVEELDFFVERNIVRRNTVEFFPQKTDYSLTPVGMSLVPVIDAIVDWGYAHLQDEQVTPGMSFTPRPAIEAIEERIAEAD
jgi:DNA-binding HxlR family transcriptional regulator